ncbi:MAG: hypothetical protein IM568_12110 [Flavobacterium sp.]|nr:hypothetical protein [Flavobacterium sp.]
MIRLILLTFIVSLSFFSCRQSMPDKDKERLDAVCNKFMDEFNAGKTSEAIQLLKENSVISPAVLDTLEIERKMNMVLPNYGKMISYEFISEQKIKDFIVRRFYIQKFENFYLKFEFTLYKSSTGWKITGFEFNEELLELLY